MANTPPRRKGDKLYWGSFLDDPFNQKPNQPFIVDLVTLEKLFFQGLPEELEYEPTANWNVVAAPGRNNPLYQYTGGEDSLSFTLTWFAISEGKDDVLMKTKWLESLIKNNGWDEKPHMVALCFGDLYRGARFIVESVKNTYKMFSRPNGMMPQVASTEIVLKRVTEGNRTRNNIFKRDT